MLFSLLQLMAMFPRRFTSLSVYCLGEVPRTATRSKFIMSDCNSEIEYSNVGYFDRQTVGDDKVEDPNEWLSVDIGDLLEEEAAAQQQSNDQIQASITDKGRDKDDSGSHPYIYDACSASVQEHRTTPSLALAATLPTKPTAVTTAREKSQAIDAEEEELKISFMNFKAGSVALFVPVDASRKVWMAFHSNKPNRFLAQQSLDVFLNRRGKNSDKTRILARIVYIEQHVAGTGHTATASGAKRNDNQDGAAADASDMIGESIGHHAHSGQKAALKHTVGSVSSDKTNTSLVSSSVVTYASDRNPYNLPPGTVYFECFAEPITISAGQRKGGARQL